MIGLLLRMSIWIISVAAKADPSITLRWLCPNIRLETFLMPAKAKLDRVLSGLFCTEISIMSLRPLKANALISVMLFESKFNFLSLLSLEKAGRRLGGKKKG